MASDGARKFEDVHLPPPATPGNGGAFRTKSIASRLTETEFAEVEAAAESTGQKVSEWLRSAALAQARAVSEEHTDPILLAEVIAVRLLMLNLFAQASVGALSKEDVRKMSEHTDAVKQRKAEEVLSQRHGNCKTPGKAS